MKTTSHPSRVGFARDEFLKHDPLFQMLFAAITKRDLFHYTYAVLHHPAYRTKYEINLKREFPRLPFYADFRQWAKWGKQLMELHLNYEQAAPFKLERHDAPVAQTFQSAGSGDFPVPSSKRNWKVPPPADKNVGATSEKPALKPKLKAIKETGSIEIDATTTLTGIPAAAWDYKLGNRSGLEWVLDQWKEHKISDPPWPPNSTPTASPTTKSRSSNFSSASAPSAWRR
jgi:predicted helicase